MSKLYLLGVDQRGLGETAQAALSQSSCVFCTGRFRELLGDFQGDILPIAPLPAALALMASRLTSGDITVLASGDPLFFGIGRALLERFGAERVVITPALSSLQLAFAHFKEPWEDATFLSLHGRGGVDILPTLLHRQKLFLLTDQRHRPEVIARALATGLADLGLADHSCRIMVAENLGLVDERIIHGRPTEIASLSFAELNVMIVALDLPVPLPVPFGSAQGTGSAPLRSLSGVEGHGRESRHGADRSRPAPGPLGLTESELQHSRGLISKDEVRAVILHRLRLPATGVFWDIGAGSGSVSVEAARLCPGLSIYSIERHPAEQANIRANRQAFRLANLQPVNGLAPDVTHDLPDPDRVFIGGSGGQLPAIVALISRRLKADGLIMASAVTAATRQLAPRLFHEHGLRVEISTLAVSRETYPPQADGPLTLNPITLILGSK